MGVRAGASFAKLGIRVLAAMKDRFFANDDKLRLEIAGFSTGDQLGNWINM